MNDPGLRARIIEQFSYTSERAGIWRILDRFLDTSAFLNVGYSPWYLSHFLGSSQMRLAREVGHGVAGLCGATGGKRLLDVGCGRGGLLGHYGREYGFTVTGMDLVPYNLAQARGTLRLRRAEAALVLGDAGYLPFEGSSFDVCTLVDVGAYVEDKPGMLEEIRRVLREGGVLGLSDLVACRAAGQDAAGENRRRLDAFSAAWDAADLVDWGTYRGLIEHAGLEIVEMRDVTANSLARFRKWTAAALPIVGWLRGNRLSEAMTRHGIDPGALFDQLRATHEALPYLQHVIVYARR